MTDFIDRNKVLEVIFNIMSDNKIVHKHRALNRNIKQIPKADTERHAHWLYRSTNRFYECSYCGNITYSSEDKYCSNCGCGMDKVKECK